MTSLTHLDAVDDGIVPGRIIFFVGVDGPDLGTRLEEVHDAKVRFFSLLHLLM